LDICKRGIGKWLHSWEDGATTWVHIDIREFEKKYKELNFFVKNEVDINSKSIMEIKN